MHFDPRTQAALREVGLSTADIEQAADNVASAVRHDADRIERFFRETEPVVSDVSLAHSDEPYQTHEDASVELYTHAADLRGWLSLDGWGVYVEGGRVLSEDVIELELGPTVHERVRFAVDRESL